MSSAPTKKELLFECTHL